MPSAGRPKGLVKTEKIEVKIQPELKFAFKKAVYEEGSNSSVKICELITSYLKERGISIGK
jgi:hypothetical protein